MSEPTHFEKFADFVMSNDGSELSMVKAERDYALHCLERELDDAEQAQDRIEALEAALREIVAVEVMDPWSACGTMQIKARAALAQASTPGIRRD